MVVGIPLNVILPTYWNLVGTVLGNAEESGLFFREVKFPLKISDHALSRSTSGPSDECGYEVIAVSRCGPRSMRSVSTRAYLLLCTV